MEASKADLLDALRQQVKEIEQRDEPHVSEIPSCGSGTYGSAKAEGSSSDLGVNAPAQQKQLPLLDSEYAFKRLTALCMHQERSTKEVRERLKRIGFEDSVADKAINRALNCGLIDDVRYADILVRSRISQGRGSCGIERELKSLGLNPYDIDAFNEYCSDSGSTAEYDRALSFLRSHPTRSKNPQSACYRKLVTKGYSSSVASRAARDFCLNRSE